jgi:hypothetical protein
LRALRANTLLPDTRLLRYGVATSFFIFFFVFLLLYIDPSVIYSSNGINIHNYVSAMHAQDGSSKPTVFFVDPRFRRPFILELTPEYFREIAVAPGGWTRLVVTLVIYACHNPFTGALAVTALALFFFWIFPVYIQGTGARRPFTVGFIPPLFLLSICAWYEMNYCVFLLPVAGALVFAVFYQRLRPAGSAKGALLLSMLFWASWYFFQWGCLLFLLFALIHEFFNKKRTTVSVAAAAAINGALLLALNAWFVPLTMIIRWSDFTALSGLPLAVIGFFPLAALMLEARRPLRQAPVGTTSVIGVIVHMSLLICGFVAVALWLCREPVNRDTRTIARTIYHVKNGQWETILHEKIPPLFADFPRKGAALQAFMIHAMDHALCRTGELGDRLFMFPQKVFAYDPLLMLQTTLSGGYVNWVTVLELAMDLGMVNLAERIAGEIMENMGPFPDIIYRRALIQIVKGNRDAAAVYLRKLACMPFYRPEAKRLLNMLDNNDTFGSEPRIAGMRAIMDTTDYLLFTVSYDAMLKHLLQSNPANKAAYDYLMTFCLLTGRPDGVAVLAPAARAFYTVLPRYWEEALCVYLAANLEKAPSMESYSGLRRETMERFNEFAQACISFKDDSTAAAELARAFGDSYFYFSVFRHSSGVWHE